jgi:hypothetical protein
LSTRSRESGQNAPLLGVVHLADAANHRAPVAEPVARFFVALCLEPPDLVVGGVVQRYLEPRAVGFVIRANPLHDVRDDVVAFTVEPEDRGIARPWDVRLDVGQTKRAFR